MPRRGGLPLFCFVAVRLYFVARRSGYQQGRINKGRSPQNCIERGCVSARPSDAILRDDELICFATEQRKEAQLHRSNLFSPILARNLKKE